MEVIAGAKRAQAHRGTIVPPRKTKSETEDSEFRPRDKGMQVSKPNSNPVNIDIRRLRKGIVPDSIFRLSRYKFDPQPFGVEEERMAERIIEPSTQYKSLDMFTADVNKPMIYGVGSSPDDTIARTFAAYLVMLHLQTTAYANVVWESLYGGFQNKLLDSEQRPTMLVLSNLAPNSTNQKLEKAKDLIDKFDDIPRVIVVSGLDPLSFLSTRLYVPTHGIFYHSSKALKQKIEVI